MNKMESKRTPVRKGKSVKISRNNRSGAINTHPHKYLISFRIIDAISTFISHFPKYFTWCYLAWQANKSIQALAGKITLASFFGNFSYNGAQGETFPWFCLLCFISAIIGIGYGLYMRRLLKKQILKDTSHRQRIERIIDRERSSSNLLSNGETNPDDE
jgi:hypothetical protein